jgi:hypothetical protein
MLPTNVGLRRKEMCVWRSVRVTIDTVGKYYIFGPHHLVVPTVMKSGSLNPLEPKGPVEACNGVALPLLHTPRVCL